MDASTAQAEAALAATFAVIAGRAMQHTSGAVTVYVEALPATEKTIRRYLGGTGYDLRCYGKEGKTPFVTVIKA